jgi:predicted O-methyltransferase YrrM
MKIKEIDDIKFLYYGAMSWIVMPRLFHKFLTPSLSDFSNFNVQEKPEDLIIKLLGKDIPETIMEEYDELQSSLQSIYNNVQLKYPLQFRIEDNTSFFIYSLVRLCQPLKIVETGVANGHSSFFILNALIKNGKGKLYSIDINPNVGSLITEDLKRNWELFILTKRNKKILEEFLKEIYPIDIFIHDSNHLYYWQELEYNLALKYVKKNGFVASDDVDGSYAFLDFIKRNKLSPFFLYDRGKIFGVALLHNN